MTLLKIDVKLLKRIVMANFLNKLKIKTAVDDRTELNLDKDHFTTANFMQLNVAYTRELVPKQSINVNMETFTRLVPMPVPTFGRATIHNRAFFVPYRTIFPGWNDFITDSPHTYGNGTTQIIGNVPTIDNDSFIACLISSGFAQPAQSGQTPDVTVKNADASYTSYVFKAQGRQALKVIESLGYKINWNRLDNSLYSALPLLALAKIYLDWYFPSAYTNNSRYAAILKLTKYDYSGMALEGEDLEEILTLCSTVSYDADYFVSAFDNPNGPNNGSASSINMPNTSLPESGYDQYNPGTVYSLANSTASRPNDPFIANKNLVSSSNGSAIVNSTINRINQYALDTLKAVTDYMKRHQLVGTRAMDRYLARFGVNLPAEKLNRCEYIGSQDIPIQFGDVMSQSDTNGAALGDYAGKGIGYGSESFSCDTDEYGLFVILSSITPKIGYFQGQDRNTMHFSKFDFWTPEFDGLGTQPISRRELYVPMAGSEVLADADALNNGVFGFAPRYAEYKIANDSVTGDFRCPSINVGEDAWHLERQFDDSSWNSAADMVHNMNFVNGLDAGQYSRIFYNTNADAADKFKVIHHFNVTSKVPMCSLFDDYDFKSKGKEVTEDVNGVKMN